MRPGMSTGRVRRSSNAPRLTNRKAVGMKQRRMGARLWSSLFGCLLLSLCLVPTAWAQQTLGALSVTVVDPSGAAVPGATLTLRDVATNEARTAVTQEAGNHT